MAMVCPWCAGTKTVAGDACVACVMDGATLRELCLARPGGCSVRGESVIEPWTRVQCEIDADPHDRIEPVGEWVGRLRVGPRSLLG